MTALAYAPPMSQHAASASLTPIARLRIWMLTRLSQIQTQRALDALSDHALNDIGLTRDMIRMTSKGVTL